MWARLSDTRVFHLYSSGVLPDLELKVEDADGKKIPGSPFIPVEIPACPLPTLYGASVIFPAAGVYRFTWTATGFKHWEEVQVVETPPADATPYEKRKYSQLLTGLADPLLYVLDSAGISIKECVLATQRVQVTGTVSAPFATAADAEFLVTLENTVGQIVSIPAGAYTLLEMLALLNGQLIGGRVIAAGAKLRLQTDALGVSGGIVLKGDGLAVLGLVADTYVYTYGDPPVSLTAIALGQAYETDYELQLPVGAYTLLWCDGPIVADWEQILVHDLLGTPYACFAVVDKGTSLGLPGISLVVLDAQGNLAAQGLTDLQGRFTALLSPGVYRVVLEQPGLVFALNAYTVTVTDRWSSGFSNDYLLRTACLRTPFGYTSPVTPSDFSTMTAQFVDLRGRPLSGITVLISNQWVPKVLTNSDGKRIGVFGVPVRAVTDAAGRVSVPLLKGIEVTAAVEATSVRRTFTVPDSAEFNLLDYFTTDDVFDIIRLNIPAAVQEDL